MEWWNDIPPELKWAGITSLIAWLGAQIALLMSWRRQDKLRFEQRERDNQKKVEDLLDTALARQEKYTQSLLQYASVSADLQALLRRTNELHQEVAQALKEFVRGGRGQ